MKNRIISILIFFFIFLFPFIPTYSQVNIYIGGSGDGGSGNTNATYLGACPWTAPPPAYTNICAGGNGDGNSTNINTTYLGACPWTAPLPPLTNIFMGGNSDGHSANANTTYLGSCPWNAPPPAYTNIAMGGNNDGYSYDTARCQNYAPFCGVTADAGTDKTICFGDSVQLNASGGTTYAWYPSAGLSDTSIANPKASPADTTTYKVIVSDAICSDTDSVVIIVNVLPSADAGSNQTICLTDSAQLGAAPAGGSTYSWTPATGLASATIANPKASPATTTVYQLVETIAATGCKDSNTVTVTLSIPAAAAGPDRTICLNDSAQLGAAPVGGSSYSWLPTTGLSSSTIANPKASPAANTTYTLTETIIATGCSTLNAVDVIVNPLPAADAGTDGTICLNDSVQIGAAPVGGNTYSWAPAGGLSSSTVANPKASPAVNTTYTLTETITATGCQKSNDVTVTVNSLPAASTGPDKAICNGSSTTIGAAPVGGNTYSWAPGTGLSSTTVSNPTADPTSNTTYTLTETVTATGCQKSNNVTVTVNSLPAADAGVNDTVCVTDSAQIGAAPVGGNTYSWTPATDLSSSTVANPKASPSSSTTYTLTETVTATGCQKSNAVFVNIVPAASITSTQDSICAGGSTILTAQGGLSGGQSYSWDPDGETTVSITASPVINTTYTVTITDVFCTTNASKLITIRVSCVAVNIYWGGISDGASASLNETYLGTCPWEVSPPALTNVFKGGVSDGASASLNDTYLGSCPWNAAPPALTNIFSGGIADGFSANVNNTYLGSCPWDAPLPALTNIFSGGGNDGSMQFDPDGCFAYDPNPLPIELLSFDATLVDKKMVLCEWVTLSEINNDFFTVEKSIDTTSVETVAVVDASGNSSIPRYYKTTDNNPYQGISYYRLKQTDFNGVFTYSSWKTIILDGMNIIQIYPNPARDEVKVMFYSTEKTEVMIILYNLLGQNVIKRTEAIKKGTNVFSLNLNELSMGCYLIEITTTNMQYRVQKNMVKN